ncbi:putative membrane protein [Anaplasma phagocytophilum str. ApMUC09]|uniref:Putative membrane protein n=1 Tax=Anaplasma phagocytophilum str. ApMUC09 TaxID=1359152 RepID=A0A0F3N7U8_ANAPH|nr:putative membrane protein [Anaplasma phagocytophilum str. ApMUC09]
MLIRLMNSIAWICIKFLFIGAVLLFGGYCTIMSALKTRWSSAQNL